MGALLCFLGSGFSKGWETQGPGQVCQQRPGVLQSSMLMFEGLGLAACAALEQTQKQKWEPRRTRSWCAQGQPPAGRDNLCEQQGEIILQQGEIILQQRHRGPSAGIKREPGLGAAANVRAEQGGRQCQLKAC